RELTMKPQVTSVCRSAFYQLRQLRSIRRLITDAAAHTLVYAFVSSRVDYCNSIYYDSNESVIKKLQSVLNASARLVTGVRRFDHVTPSLKSLHWLPVHQRINYKLATMVYGCLHDRLPMYLKDACIPVA